MELRGEHLVLREPRPDDAEALFGLGSDPEVVRWFSWGPYESIDQPRAWIDEQEGKRERGEQLDLLIVHREHGPLGVTGLVELQRRNRHAIVGSWLARSAWGTGVNEEAKALIAHLGFAVCGLERLGAYANVENGRSRRALAKVGFREEGILHAYHRHADGPKDVVIAALLRHEWEAGPLAAMPVEVEGAPPAVWIVA